MIVLKLAFAAIAFIIAFIATVGWYDADRNKALYYKRRGERVPGDVWFFPTFGYAVTVLVPFALVSMAHVVSPTWMWFSLWSAIVTGLLFVALRYAHPWIQSFNTPNVDSRGYPLTEERTKNQQLADK